MADINITNLTNLNLTDIENSLKDFLKQTPEFSGYNFEGSVLNRLVKVLAYNTYNNAYYLNMVGNESFLDSAQLRENVVSKAKALGYIPRSKTAATARLNLVFTPDDAPNSIFIPKYTAFKSTIDGTNYTFITLTDNYVQNSNGSYTKAVDIFEGQSYTYNIAFDSNKVYYEIPDEKVDVSKLRVYVRPSGTSTNRVEYSQATDITEIKSDSQVYFIQENAFGKYEIYFGDGVLGEKLSVGNIIQIEALITNGAEANDIQVFSPIGFTGYDTENLSSSYVAYISSVLPASQGSERESIDSIKFSAPKQFAMQKRSVIAKDYTNFLKTRYPDLESIATWGGEDNDPPVYGRVMISVKPYGGYVISNYRKNQIAEVLSKKNVLSIDPLLVDPIFTFINITTDAYFNQNATTKTSDEVFGMISKTIKEFEKKNMNLFNGEFHLSRLTAAIDQSDASLINNTTTVRLEKRITPIYNTTITYKLRYNGSLKNPYAGYQGCVTSTRFRLGNTGDEFCYLDDDGLGKIRIYFINGINKIYVNTNAGSVDYNNGEILLNSFSFRDLEVNTDELRIMAEPESTSYLPLRNEILLFSFPQVTLLEKSFNAISQQAVIDVLGNLSPIKTNAIFTPVVV